jgi:tetratricopeptide (TPR) repeat protein
MAENVDAIVQAGIRAYKAGKKDEARALLLKATDIDQYNEDAWLWLSGLMESPEDQRQCLENVLVINPANERARKGLNYLLSKAKPAPAPEPPPAPPRASSGLSTSVEWAAPDESVPMTGRAFTSDPADVDYDAWVSNLNIAAPQRGAKPFSTDSVTFDDDVLTQGPFGSDAIFIGTDDDSAFEPPRTAASPSHDDEEVSLPAEASAALDAVSAALSAAPPAPAAPLAAPAAKAPSPFDGVDLDVGDFGKDEADKPAAPPRETRKARREAEKAAKAAAKAERDAQKTAYLPESELDPQSRAVIQDLQVIPREIEPTRLPGTHEKQPILLAAAFILLILLNIGAAALLINRILVPLS